MANTKEAKETARKPARKNLYKGTMTPEEAQEKVTRIAKRLKLTRVHMGVGARKGSARIAFTFSGARVERTCHTQETAEANTACLALWLEDRARNIERGIETFDEAFADSLTLEVVGSSPERALSLEENSNKRAAYEGNRSLEECIALLRSSLERLGISETDVKLTWNTEEHWARLRMRLPSGSIVDKTSRMQKTHVANVAALALWLQSRTKNWERGIEDVNLDRVFAGNLLPAKVA